MGLPGLIEVAKSLSNLTGNPMSSVQQNVIKHKVGLLNLAAELGNVSRACKVMGFSRDTFYSYQSAMESGGIDVLLMSIVESPIPRTE